VKLPARSITGVGALLALASVLGAAPAHADTPLVSTGGVTVTALDDGTFDFEQDLVGTLVGATTLAVTPPISSVGSVTQTFDTKTDALSSGDIEAAASDTSGGCDPQGEVTYQYTPVPSTFKDKGIQMSYTVVPYQRNHAHFRPDTLEFTWQVALCGFGGSKAYNGWRLLRSGLGISLAASGQKNTTVKIGQAYDTSVSDGMSAGTINFSVTAGPGSVGVSIGTTPVGKNKGDAGVDGPQSPDAAVQYSRPNAVHGYWENYSSFYVPPRNKGSRDFQGSIVEGLYEMGETTQPSAGWTLQSFAKRHCTTATYSCPT
jgi:hypothetical protein